MYAGIQEIYKEYKNPRVREIQVVKKYNLMKPTKQQKSSHTIMRIKDYIGDNGKICGQLLSL